jgi:protein involved in polysaccharide export with SLBB domain
MKVIAFLSSVSRGFLFVGVMWAAVLITGCQVPTYLPPPPGVAGPTENMGTSAKFRVGDLVMINFSTSTSDSTPILPPHREAIKENGMVTPPLVGPMLALGKTPGELQSELQTNYNRYYVALTVTVLPADRFYYVSGEVRKPGPEPYLGETSVVKAISAAMGFTDFANQKSVRLTRANGQQEVVNVKAIMDGRADDIPIYPGDSIMVKRRLW